MLRTVFLFTLDVEGLGVGGNAVLVCVQRARPRYVHLPVANCEAASGVGHLIVYSHPGGKPGANLKVNLPQMLPVVRIS